MAKQELHLPAAGGFSTFAAVDIRNWIGRQTSDSPFRSTWSFDLRLTNLAGEQAYTPSGQGTIQVTLTNVAGWPAVADILAAGDAKLRNDLGMADGGLP